ncbi:MAG: acyloxyacyl hydrolase [Pseudomonadota bacterium]
MTAQPRHFFKSCMAASMLALMAGVAQAESAFVDELRFGGTWAQPAFLDGNHPEKDQFAINGEVLFAPLNLDRRADAPNDFVNALLSPRLHLGGTVNFDNNGTSLVYSGLTWHFGLTENLFLETSFGGSLNNGERNYTANRAPLGATLLFRESIALGYRVSPQMNVILQIDHNSNADLADRNRGLTATHLKIGYKF